jgi:chitin disaccharide deacetylase
MAMAAPRVCQENCARLGKLPALRYDMAMRRLIVTADDFGMSPDVNEAVEDAHRRGILSAASLMVGGDAAADAIARARRIPRLGIGLHLVLVDGKPVLSPEQLVGLVDATDRFPNTLAPVGARIYLSAAARRQAAAEIRAQLEAFRATGLALDHVNAHHHFHLHPTIRDILIELAPEFGIRAVRVPREPTVGLGNLVVQPFVASLRRRLDRAGIAYNDWQLGLRHSGAMDPERTQNLLAHLPEGVSEIYFHPSQGNIEHQTLVEPRVAASLRKLGIKPIPFAAL